MMPEMSIFTKVKLGRICRIDIGKTPSRSNPDFWGKGFTWVSISDLDENKVISESKEEITSFAVKSTGIKKVAKGTLLFSFKLSIGKVAFAGKDLYTNEAIAAFTIFDEKEVCKDYFYYVLREFDYSCSGDKAVKGKTLNKKKLHELLIPFPPFHNQQRIATILDHADTIRRKNIEILKKYNELAQSVFLEMFGDPIKNTKKWKIDELQNMLLFITSGSRGWARYYAGTGDIFLRIQNVGKNKLKLEDLTFVNVPDTIESKRTKVEPGDIILSITADLGRTGVIPDNFPKAHINQHLAIVRLNKENMNPYFVSEFLSSDGGKIQFDKLTKGGVKAGLNFNDLKSLKIPVPSMDLQEEYELRLKYIENQKQLAQQSMQKSEELFKSLLQRAFKGEL